MAFDKVTGVSAGDGPVCRYRLTELLSLKYNRIVEKSYYNAI